MSPLALNAQFESLHSFFNSEGWEQSDHTMTPIQREFVRLAQIFKSRLITEMELNQRVMERALIEERIGNVAMQSRKAQQDEAEVRTLLNNNRTDESKHRQDAKMNLGKLVASAKGARIFGEMTIDGLQILEALSGDILRSKSGCAQFNEYKISFSFDPDTQSVVFTHEDGRTNATPEVKRFLRGSVDAMRSLYDNELCRYRFVKHEGLRTQAEALLACFPAKSEIEPTAANLRKVVALQRNITGLVEGMVAYSNLVESEVGGLLSAMEGDLDLARLNRWFGLKASIQRHVPDQPRNKEEQKWVCQADNAITELLKSAGTVEAAIRNAELTRQPLDHKKFLDMLVDELEDKHIELLEGTRAHIANIDNYIKRVATSLEDDFNRQFYHPAFECVRKTSRYRDVTFGQIETTTILANNREFAKVSPMATMEFDLPARELLITEGMKGAKTLIDEYGALVSDPSFLALSSLRSGSSPANLSSHGLSAETRHFLGNDVGLTSGQNPGKAQFGSALESLIPDPAVYKFETGTGYEIRPVIQPDGQAVVFDFNYLYTTEIREPVRADEKHLGRVRQHAIDTDVQLSNYELRQVSKYQVALKASRTSRGVPLLENIPVAGALFRPLPQQESSLQQNLIYAQATIYPTLFDLMGLRWAPAVTDLDSLRLSNAEYIVRGRHRHLQNRVYDYSSSKVDDFLRTPGSRRRTDLYRTQETIPAQHPNGYRGRGLDYQQSILQEGDASYQGYIPQSPIPASNREGSIYREGRQHLNVEQVLPPEPYGEVFVDEMPAESSLMPLNQPFYDHTHRTP